MENISLSLPRRSFSSNTPFASHKSIYDDVFGGPPKLGLPSLAPRCEDYSEIFGGFHTSQSSSIPVLHLPVIASDDSNLHIEVDYTEVFGGCGGFDYTTSLQDLVGQYSGVYDPDSSGEPWYYVLPLIYCLPRGGGELEASPCDSLAAALRSVCLFLVTLIESPAASDLRLLSELDGKVKVACFARVVWGGGPRSGVVAEVVSRDGAVTCSERYLRRKPIRSKSQI